MLSLTRPLLAIIFFFFAVVVLSSVGFVYYNIVPVVSDEIVPSAEQMERMLSKSATMYSPLHCLFPAFTSCWINHLALEYPCRVLFARLLFSWLSCTAICTLSSALSHRSEVEEQKLRDEISAVKANQKYYESETRKMANEEMRAQALPPKILYSAAIHNLVPDTVYFNV